MTPADIVPWQSGPADTSPQATRPQILDSGRLQATVCCGPDAFTSTCIPGSLWHVAASFSVCLTPAAPWSQGPLLTVYVYSYSYGYHQSCLQQAVALRTSSDDCQSHSWNAHPMGSAVQQMTFRVQDFKELSHARIGQCDDAGCFLKHAVRCKF